MPAFYYRFIKDAIFSAVGAHSHPVDQSAHIGDCFEYDPTTLSGRFKQIDFHTPVPYIQNLVDGQYVVSITFLEYLQCQGFPPINSLIDPLAIAQALMGDPTLHDQLIQDLVDALKADQAFLDAVKGDPGIQGVPGNDGVDGQDGVSPTPQSIADILKNDPAFQALVKGQKGDTGNPGTSGPPGPAGASFGALGLVSVVLNDMDRLTTSPTFVQVPGATAIVTTTSLQERLMIVVDACGFAAKCDGKPHDISLDVEVDGVRLGGQWGGVLTVSLPADYLNNCAFTIPSQPLGPGNHVVNLLFKSPSAARVGLRAHQSTNPLRMYIIHF